MNAQTMYTLSTDTEYFTVDAVTGDLYTTEALRITQEVTSELTVDVTAYNTVPYVCDECSNDTVPVTVNIQVHCYNNITAINTAQHVDWLSSIM